MRNLSENPYINFRAESIRSHTLNSFLFNDDAVGKTVGAEHFLMAVWDLLLILHFDFQLCGFKYLARLVKHSLVDGNYSEQQALTEIARYYGANDKFVVGCIRDLIELNNDFTLLAARYMNVPLRDDCTATLGGTVDVIAALFVKYYNLYADVKDKSDERRAAIGIDKVFEYGKI